MRRDINRLFPAAPVHRVPAFAFRDLVFSRLNKILDAVGNAELNVNVRPSETEFLVESAQKVANRITTGLILAALMLWLAS